MPRCEIIGVITRAFELLNLALILFRTISRAVREYGDTESMALSELYRILSLSP